MAEPPGHVAGGSVGLPSCGSEGAETWMWTDWQESVQDEDKTGGELMDEDWMGSRTRTGLVVWRKLRRQARKGPIGQGERGYGGRSGRS